MIFDVCSVEYPVRDVVENLTIDCHYRIILIAVCAGERKALIELVKEAKNLLQTQTWELCPKSLCWQGRSPRTRMGKSKRPNILEYTPYSQCKCLPSLPEERNCRISKSCQSNSDV